MGDLMEDSIVGLIRSIELIDEGTPAQKLKSYFKIKLELEHTSKSPHWYSKDEQTSTMYLKYFELPPWAKVGSKVIWKMQQE